MAIQSLIKVQARDHILQGRLDMMIPNLKEAVQVRDLHVILQHLRRMTPSPPLVQGPHILIQNLERMTPSPPPDTLVRVQDPAILAQNLIREIPNQILRLSLVQHRHILLRNLKVTG